MHHQISPKHSVATTTALCTAMATALRWHALRIAVAGGLALFWLTGASAASAPPPCCGVTNIARNGEITARETNGARTFQFQVADPALLRGLRVGSPVYANFDTRQVSLDGTKTCCTILNISTTAKQPVPGTTPAAPGSVDSGPGSTGSAATKGTKSKSSGGGLDSIKPGEIPPVTASPEPSTAGAMRGRPATPDPRTAPLQQSVNLPPQISSVALNPSSVIGGALVTGTVTLQPAAGASGVTVKLQSSAPSIAAVPASTFVQPGSTSTTFIVQTYPVAANPNVVGDLPSVEISANLGASPPKTAKLTVRPPTLASFTIEPSSVPGGSAAMGTIGITSPAPAAGFTVTLLTQKASSESEPKVKTTILRQPALVTVPQKITVPGNATTATFSVSTKGVLQATPVQVIASYGPFVSKTATLTLLPPSVSSVSTTPPANNAGNSVVIGGQSLVGMITLTAPAPAEGVSIPLSVIALPPTSIPACGPPPTFPAIVQIAAGSTTTTFPITTSPGKGFHIREVSGKHLTIYVREPWIKSTDDIGTLALFFPPSVKGGTRVDATFQLDGPPSTCGLGLHYKLQSSNTNLAQVPSEATVTQGSSVGLFSFTTTAVPTPQTVDISVYAIKGGNPGWWKKTLTLTP